MVTFPAQRTPVSASGGYTGHRQWDPPVQLSSNGFTLSTTTVSVHLCRCFEYFFTFVFLSKRMVNVPGLVTQPNLAQRTEQSQSIEICFLQQLPSKAVTLRWRSGQS
jgi:hypothetical protein